MKMNKSELNSIEEYLIKVSKKAGKEILKYKEELSGLKIKSKKSQGIVSEADFASEQLIIEALAKKFPDIPVLAEETYFKKYKDQKDAFKLFEKHELLWVIDPLDGTNNFVHGLDLWCVCIGLVYKGQPIVGVVHCPERKETFSAAKGLGTRYNKGSKTVQIAKNRGKSSLKMVMLATGFATEKGEVLDKEFETFYKVMAKVRAIRRLGSAAFDLCYAALGVFDGFWERGLAPWDMAAPAIICTEAGLKITEYDGAKHSPFSPTILAARPNVHKQLQQIILD